MNLTLNRDAPRMDCQEGILDAGTGQYYTMERAPTDPDHPCIPARFTYEMVPYDSPTHGETWCFHCPAANVYAFPFGEAPPGYGQYESPNDGERHRTLCELHGANQAWQLLGCIAPGKGRGLLDLHSGHGLLDSVFSSDESVREIVALLGPMTSGHTLTINAPA
jgi:hypothetical protein